VRVRVSPPVLSDWLGRVGASARKRSFAFLNKPVNDAAGRRLSHLSCSERLPEDRRCDKRRHLPYGGFPDARAACRGESSIRNDVS